MARIYSQQLALHKDSSSWGPVGPDPGTLWIIRQILVYNGNTDTSGLICTVSSNPSGTIFFFFPFPDDSRDIAFFTGRVVIPDDQTIQGFSGSDLGASGLDWYVGGYVLTEP